MRTVSKEQKDTSSWFTNNFWLIKPQYVVIALCVFAGLSTWLLRATHAETGITAPAQDFTDISYASTSDAQKLDLHLPARHGTPVPLVVDIHGGAFMGGDKGDESYNYSRLLAAGYAVASVNYRLSEEAQFPAGGQDVKAAVRWLRANADTYGIDTYRFAAWGRSAGGYMADMLGTTGDQSTVFDNDSLGNASYSDAVQAVVSFYGPTDFATMDNQARQYCNGDFQVHDAEDSPESIWLRQAVQESPLTSKANLVSYVNGNTKLPAFFLTHGKKDCTVPYPQSVELYDALKAKGQNPTLELKDGYSHADPDFDNEMTDIALPFLQQTFAAIQTDAPAPADPTIKSFIADSTAIDQGKSTSMQWQTSDADACSISPDAGRVPINGSWNTPALTTAGNKVYTLTCSNSAGKQVTSSVTITINNAAVPDPVISEFSASPSSIETGSTSRLTWKALNVDAAGCALSPSPMSSALASGTWVTPTLTASTTYTLMCVNSEGKSVSKVLTVTITQSASTKPTEPTTPTNPTTPTTPTTQTTPTTPVEQTTTTTPATPTTTTTTTPATPAAPSTTSTSTPTSTVSTNQSPTPQSQTTTTSQSSQTPITPIAKSIASTQSQQTMRSTITENTTTPIANSVAGNTVSGETTLDATNVTDTAKESTIKKTEYYENGKLIYTDTTEPYTLDTTKLKDGEHTITERTYYNGGSSSDTVDTILVSNKTVSSSGGGRTAAKVGLGITVTSMVILGALAVGIFVKRRTATVASTVISPQDSYGSTVLAEDDTWQKSLRGPNGQ